jgi:hypothetical protein
MTQLFIQSLLLGVGVVCAYFGARQAMLRTPHRQVCHHPALSELRCVRPFQR